MTSGLKTFVFPVVDLTAAKQLYSALLGTEPSVDSPYYIGYDIGDLHVGLAPQTPGVGAVGYWTVDDIEAKRDELIALGATEQVPVNEVGGGRRIAVLTDADGNALGLLQDA